MKIECSPAKPWGIHPFARNDETCPRCGWTAPGPLGDARRRAAQAEAEHGWVVISGGEAAAAPLADRLKAA